MTEDRLNILYLCADRGIAIDGLKGAAAHMREFASAMAGVGHGITVVTRGSGNGVPSELPFRSVILPLNPSALIFEAGDSHFDQEAAAEFAEFQQNPFIKRTLSGLSRQEKYDVVYERYSLFSVAGLNFARSANLPFILEVNAPLVVEAARYRRLCLPQLARALERHLFAAADHVVAVSKELKGYIIKAAPEARVTVVPNGVDIDKYASRLSREGNGGAGDAGSRDFTVGFIGNLRPWHGIDILLEAFSRLSGENNGGRLLVVGDAGKMRRPLGKLCRKLGLDGEAVFTGAVPQERVPDLLSQIDVAVAPYPKLEDFYFSSLKIFEYMAAGKPIVASRIGQIAEILEDEKTALLVPPGDLEALTLALVRLRDDPALRQRLGQAAREEVASRHTWNNRIEVITGIARSLRKIRPGEGR